MSEILRIIDLWGGYQKDVDILCGISMEFHQGEAVGVIGLNGSGKSTFGKAIMNMIPFRRGQIIFEGEDITSLKTSELSHRGISIMQQGGKVFQNLSVWENLLLASKGNITPLAEIIPILQRPQRELKHLMADKLSGGQKHQLSLAMTLSSQPKFVILDEPSAGLSPKSVDDLYQILDKAKKKFNFTVILIEQNIQSVLNYCDFVHLFKKGQIIKEKATLNKEEIETLIF